MVKLTAVNLLPLPFYAGGQILVEVLSSVLRRPVRPPDSLMIVFLLLGLVMTYMAGKELWIYLAR